MSMQELKQEMLTAVNQTEDEFVLEEVRDILYREHHPDTEPFKLTEGMKVSIREGQAAIARGEFITNEDAEVGLDEFFKEEDKKWGGK